jgi:AAA15 family ATPase/GTPase
MVANHDLEQEDQEVNHMNHIDDFTIHAFRGLQELKIGGLSQVNLFVGANNSGKTSVLEALSIFANPLNWETWRDAGDMREMINLPLSESFVEMLTWLFPRHADSTPTQVAAIFLEATGKIAQQKVSAEYEKFTEISQRISLTKPTAGSIPRQNIEVNGVNIHISVAAIADTNSTETTTFEETLTFTDFRNFFTASLEKLPPFPVQIVLPFSFTLGGVPQELWSEVVKAGMKTETIHLLQYFDPDIEEIDLIAEKGSQPTVSVMHNKLGLAPLSTFGSGLRRVFILATTIPKVKNGFLLIDELESAIHTKALKKTMDWLIQSCKQNNVQLFATTHSLEAVDTVIASTREATDFTFYRMEQDKGLTTCVRLNKEMITQLREELGAEVR